MEIRAKDICNSCGHGVKKGKSVVCEKLGRINYDLPTHCLHYTGSQMPIDLAVLCATETELKIILEVLAERAGRQWETHVSDENGYWRILQVDEAGGCAVRVAVGQAPDMGLSAASTLTTTAIHLFRPSYLVMSGIAAGRKGKCKFGDVLVPSEIWDYGAGKWEEDANQELVFRSRPAHKELDYRLRQWSGGFNVDSNFGIESLTSWNHRTGGRGGFEAADVLVGPHASGAAVVDSEKYFNEILKQNDKLIGIEMEAFGFAYAVEAARSPNYQPIWLIAKSVCDFGVEKNDHAQEYAAFTSAKFLLMFVDDYVFRVLKGCRPMQMNIV